MSVKFSNNATTELASSIGTSDTSITVVDASKFPILTAGDYTYVTLDTDTASPTREIVKVTAISGNVLTVTRGMDGTSPASFAAGTKVELRLTAALLNDVAGANPSGEPIGFPDKSQTTITFDSGTRTFSITPTGASFDVYCKGVKYTYTAVQLVTIPNTTGLHFIYFSASGVLSTQMSYFTWEEHAPTAYVYWNATTQQAIYFADERHGITLDWQTHEYLHRTRGAAIANGFAASGYTTTGLGATDADAQIDIGGGTFFDEDMQVDIVSTNTPVAGTWQQDLSGPARIPVLYLSGSAWVIDAPTNFPFKVVSSVPQYNLYSGGTWSTASVTNNSYFVSWILATNNLTYPVVSIISQAPTNQVSVAEAMTFEGLNLNGFPSVEFRPLYKVIYQYKDGFANSVKSSTIAVYDLRSISSAGVAAALVQDHGNLSGLTDDDHPQYVHTSEVRTPSAAVKNSFFPSQVGQTGKYLSTDGTNTVWEPAPSGSLSFTGDVTGTGSTGSSVAMTLAASGVVAGQYTKVTVDAKGRVTAGTGVTSSDVTTALGYTPYNATNPAGYTTNVGTVTSVSGTGTVSGLTLTGSVTSSGSLTLGGTLSLTSGQVTSALGFTPYNATNPSGYITGITSGMVTTALGYTPYNSSNPSGYITSSSLSSYLPLSGGTVTGNLFVTGTIRSTSGVFQLNDGASTGGGLYFYKTITGSGTSLAPSLFAETGLPLYFMNNGSATPKMTLNTSGELIVTSKVYVGGATVNSGYNGIYGTNMVGAASGNKLVYFFNDGTTLKVDAYDYGTSSPLGFTIGGNGGTVNLYTGATVSGNAILHAGNYNDYAPKKDGTGANGTWSINITGNANSLDGYDSNAFSAQNSVLSASDFQYGAISLSTNSGFSLSGLTTDTDQHGRYYYSGAGQIATRYIPVDKNGLYRMKIRWKASAASGTYIAVFLLDTNGNNINGAGTYWAYPWSGASSPTSWTENEYWYFGSQMPSNAAYVAFGISHTNYGGGSATYYVSQLEIQRVQTSVNGSAILHAGNYSGYALPIGGGTLTGNVTTSHTGTISTFNGRTFLRTNATGDSEIGGGAGSGYTSIFVTNAEAARFTSSALSINGSRPIQISSSDGAMFVTASAGGWSMGTYFKGNSGTIRAGFGALGSNNDLTYAWIGTGYDGAWMTLTPSAINSTVALQQGGNQVLHAGNYGDYALPKTGGTMTGGLNVGTAIGSRATSLSVSGSTNSSAIAAKSSDYATVFGVLPHSGSYTYFSTGVYYQSGSWVHASSNDNSALFSISGNLGAQWWASSNSSASWNLASGASLWNVSGTWIGALNAASGAQVNGSNIWHAGNFTPGNYLALSGGTLSGAIRAPQITAGGSNNTDANLGVQGTSHLTGQIYYGGTVGNVNSWSSTSTSVSGTHTFSGSRFIFDRYGYGSQPLIDMQSSSITFGQPAYATNGITVNDAAANGRGINLYSGSPTSPDYGLFFAQTGNFSTYGSVSGDWATYFTMNNDPARGWIFRNVGAGNVAAINARGDMTLKSHLELGNNLGYPNVEWNTASSSSGMVIFYLPGTTGNYGMVHMVFDIYEYDSPRVATVIVGGHNWSTSWYNMGCNVVGYTDKQVRVGVKNGRFCVVFGTSGSGWSYGTVILRKVHNGGFYNNNMNMTGDWETAQTTTESFTYVSGDLRGLRTPSTMQVDGILYGYNSIRSNIFYDNDNTSYYIDGASTSRLNELQSDRTYGFTDIRSPIFYDYNNTGYYCDPASSSRLSTIYCGDVYNDLGGWFRNYGATGIYNQSYGNHFYSDSANYWNVGIGGQTSGGIRFRDSHAGTVRGYVYVDNGNNIGFLNSSGNWRARVVADDYFLVDGSSARAQIFYDSNDTGYYCNPNDWSLLWGLKTYYIKNNYDVSTDHPFGLFFANGESTAYAIYRESGAWTYPYPDLRIAFHTGIKIGANSSYQGVRFYTDYDMSSQVMSVNNGSDPLGGGNVYVNSALQAGGSLRAPIFYDANNTGYYIDPAASTSIRTVGAWRSDSDAWDGEFSGKIQYHSSYWYLQSYNGWFLRNSGGTNVVTVDSSGNLTANGNVTAYSDRRLKDNVRDLTGAKAYLNKISAKRFTWKDDGYEDIGFIAQDVEAAGLTEFVLETADYDPNTETTSDPVKTLDYGRMVSVLWQAVKEQELQISSMLDEIKSLKERLH